MVGERRWEEEMKCEKSMRSLSFFTLHSSFITRLRGSSFGLGFNGRELGLDGELRVTVKAKYKGRMKGKRTKRNEI